MSISQAVVSYTTPFPGFPVEEPAPRPGNGPAFAAAFARDRPAQQDPARIDPPEEAVAEPVEETPEEGAEDSVPQEAEGETAAEDTDDGGTQPQISAVAPQQILPALLPIEPPPQAGAEATPLASAPRPDLRLPQTLPATAADTPDGLAGEERIVVSAAQLPFVQIPTGRAATPESPGDADLAVIAGLAPSALSPAAQASLAVAGFSQGLTVVRTSAQAAKVGAEPAPDPEPTPIPGAKALVQTAAAPPLPEAASDLANLSGDPDASMPEGSALAADGTVEALPLTGSSHVATMPAPSAPSAAPVVATPTQLAPIVLGAVMQGGKTDITVTLSPAELGTLHMRVSMEGDALRVTLLADRPETLDLLRRHGDQLLSDLRNLGFGGASLGFGSTGGGGPAPRPAASEPTDALPATAPPQQISPAPSRLVRAGGIDIRL